MIAHVVLFRLKAGVSEQDEQRLIAEARRRLPLIPGVRNLKAGKRIGEGADSYSIALVMDLPDAAALEAYRVHPEHLKFVKEAAEPLVSEVFRFDFLWQ